MNRSWCCIRYWKACDIKYQSPAQLWPAGSVRRFRQRDSSVLLQYVPFSVLPPSTSTSLVNGCNTSFLWLTTFFQMHSVLKISLFFLFFARANSVELVKKQMRGRESAPAGFWKGIYLFQLANHNSGSIFNTTSMPNFSLMHEGLGIYVLWEISLCTCLHL